jgi:hypothetical protein
LINCPGRYILGIYRGGEKMAKGTRKSNPPAQAEKQKISIGDQSVQEEISRLAAEIYKKRGNKPGDSLSDWLEAEKQVKRKYGI